MTGTERQRDLGRYRLQTLVARGGMGEIWRGVDTTTGEAVAIKRLFLDRASEAYRARLVREAQALKRLTHDNVVRLLDAGIDDMHHPYLVLEWLQGQDLDAWRQQPSLDLAQILDVAQQALLGLAACHARGIIHRDIKPGNLFLVPLQDGFQVKVVDLGLALLKDESTRLTATRTVMGTIAYLSPEQARGESDVDGRTDLWAMGVILYELCTGRLPFLGDQEVTILLKIITETPPRPRQLRPDLPLWLENVIVRAMQRSPSDRYASADEMLEALSAQQASGVVSDPLPMIADGLGETIASVAPTGSLEYRLVSMLCVQPLTRDPDIHRETRLAVEHAGGQVFGLLGGQMVGLFGLARTFGDEGLRAVRAGQAVRDAIGQRVRLLAATVHLEVGQGIQLDAGDIDLTIRTLSALPPGELVVDPPTQQLVTPNVELRQVGEHRAVVAIVSEERPRSRVSGVETPIIGRDSELASIRAAFYRVADNDEAEAVLVLGPAGIGKSRLVQELLSQLREGCSLCLHARGDLSKSKSPYGLMAEAISRQAGVHVGGDEVSQHQALAAFVSRHVPGVDREAALEFIGEAIGVPLQETPSLLVAREDPKVMRERVTGAFEILLQAAASAGPVILCFDDLHWADEESLNLCEALLDRLERTPLFVMATSRPDLLERRPQIFEDIEGTRIELGSLGRRSMRRLIQSLLGRKISPSLEALIAKWCDGNPYFAEELVSWLLARKALVTGPAGLQINTDLSALELPVGVEGAIQGRLDRLEPSLKELVKAASVFGDVLWEGGCEALGFSEVARSLTYLEHQQFISARKSSRFAGTREWVFRNALVQQVAYRMLPPEPRRLLHAKVARWLETAGETDAPVIASHFQRGGEVHHAADYYNRAGARALADGDLEGAVEHYRSSLSGSPRLHEQAERKMGLARALIHLGRYDEALDVVDRLSTVPVETDGTRQSARIAFLRGRILYALGRYAEAEDLLVQATAGLDPLGDAALLFDIRHTLFWVIWVQGRYDDATQAGWELFIEAEKSARVDYLCSAKLALAYCNLIAGDPATAIQLAEAAVEDAREIGHPFREADALTLLGSAQEIVGLYDRARDSLDMALTLATRLKTIFLQASVSSCLGRVSLALDDAPAAIEFFQTAVEHAESIREIRTLAISLSGMARALCLRRSEEDLLRAFMAAEQAVELAQQRVPPVEAEARMALAQVSLAMDNMEQAVGHAVAAVEVLDRLGTQERCEVEILLTAHDALLATGRKQEAGEMLERAWRAFEQQAERITDATVRDSYTRQVPYNVRLVHLYRGSDPS